MNENTKTFQQLEKAENFILLENLKSYEQNQIAMHLQNISELFQSGTILEEYENLYTIDGLQNEADLYYTYLPPIEDKAEYTTEDIEQLNSYFLDMYEPTEEQTLQALCDVLSIISGELWELERTEVNNRIQYITLKI